MPYLRFTRDRQGYENTFLVHTVQHGGRQQPRVLYWFRSPPQIKVGRAAIDEDAIRELEARHPNVAFAWSRILQSRPADPPDERAGAPRPLPGPPRAVETDRGRDLRRRPARQPESPPDLGRHAGLPPRARDERQAPRPALEPSAAQQVLGADALGRLRGRYAEIQARLSQYGEGQAADGTQPESASLSDLRALAERLNPDAWVTTDEVHAGVAEFGRLLNELRRRMGWSRRRTRGGRKHRAVRADATGDADPAPEPPPPDPPVPGESPS